MSQPGTGTGQEQDPDALRRDITATREGMGQTIDEIEDRVRPGRIVQRRTARARRVLTRARHAVMGASEDVRQGARSGGGSGGERAQQAGERVQQAGERVRERAGGAMDTVEHAPDMAMERTRGNPLGAGLIAFGAGVVAAGLLPDSRAEQRVASSVNEQLQPVKEQLSEAAGEVGRDTAGVAREAAGRTADHAREEATQTSREVREEASGQSGESGSGQQSGPSGGSAR